MNAEPTQKTKDRAGVVREEDFIADGVVVAGIDPGSRHSAIVIRDGDIPIHASTVTRDGNQDGISYAKIVISLMKPIIDEYLEQYPDMIVAIEGISDPKGFKGGRRAAINPKDIIRTGITVGALVAVFPDAIIVAPGGNGSQHESQYPPSLKGRRPKDLDGDSTGAGTRRHEQSAYDVAGKAKGNN